MVTKPDDPKTPPKAGENTNQKTQTHDQVERVKQEEAAKMAARSDTTHSPAHSAKGVDLNPRVAPPPEPAHSPQHSAPSRGQATVGGFAFGADPGRERGVMTLKERGIRRFAGYYDRLVEESDFRPGQRLWLIIGKDGRGESVQEESPPNDVPCCEVVVSLSTDTRFDLLTTPSGAAIPEFPNPRPEIRPIEHTPEGEQIPAAETAARHEAARQERRDRIDSLIPEGTNPSTVQAAVEAKAQDEAIKQG